MQIVIRAIARFVVTLRLRKSKFDEQSFSTALGKSRSFLVLMPENEEDFKYAVDILSFLRELKKEITVLTYDYCVSSLPLPFRGTAIGHGIKDINKINLPSLGMIKKISRKNFDALLDLNIKEQLYYAYVTAIANTGLRIGFKKKLSDKLYNLQISNDETNPKISYKNLLNCLKMF